MVFVPIFFRLRRAKNTQKFSPAAQKKLKIKNLRYDTRMILDPCLQGIGAPLVPRESESIPTFCHSFGGTTPDQATGSQIHFPEQGLGPKTLCVTLLRPSVHTQDLVAHQVSPRGIKVSDRDTKGPGGKNRISLVTPPPNHPDSLTHYYLSIYRTGTLSSWSSGACGDL